MAYECFDITTDGGVAHIQLNRPEKRNAMTRGFWDELPEAVRALDKSGDTRVIVLSSTGPHFSAGIDLASFADMAGDLGSGETQAHKAANRGLAFYQNVKRMQKCFTALEQARVPVLCAIQGGCIGGGVDLVTACDMRYASSDAYFTVYEINIGMTADVGTFPRLLNILPEGIVRELSYTGRKMPAEEALQRGLVNQVYDNHEALLEGVMALAEEIATKAPLAIHGLKKIITYARDHTTDDTLDYISIWNASMLQQSEVTEAMTAKMTKKPGNFAPLPPLKKVAE